MIEDFFDRAFDSKIKKINTIFLGEVLSYDRSNSICKIQPSFSLQTFKGDEIISVKPPVIIAQFVSFGSGEFSVNFEPTQGSTVVCFALQAKEGSNRSFSLSDCICLPMMSVETQENVFYVGQKDGLRFKIAEWAPTQKRIFIGNDETDLLDVFNDLLDQLILTVAPTNLPALSAKALELKIKLSEIRGLL